MTTPYNRYSQTQGTADQINTKGFVSAYKLNPDGTPVGGIPSLGESTPVAPTESALEKAQREHYEGLNKSQPNEEQIRADIRKRMQGTIDAIDMEYQNLFAIENQNAQDRLGQTRAVNSRSGLMGSDIGQSNTSGTQMQNLRVRQALEAEKSQKIASVFTKIDEDAKEEIKAKKAEALGNTEKWLSYLEKSASTAKDSVKTLAEGGVSLEELAPEQYKKLLEKSGMDEFTLKAFYNSNKPATDPTKTSYKTEIKGGKIIAYGINAQGQIEMTSKDLPAGSIASDGEYETKFGDDGSLILIPKTFDPTKPIASQIIQAGNYGKPDDAAKEGWSKAAMGDRAKAQKWVQEQEGFTPEDLKALQNDPSFFMYALSQVD